MTGIPDNMQNVLTQQWVNMLGWFQINLNQNNINKQVSALPVLSSSTTINCCYLLNLASAMGNEGGGDPIDYAESGLGTITYASFVVSQMSNLCMPADPVTFPDQTANNLPIINCSLNFDVMEIDGTYNYSQNCQEYYNGKTFGDPLPQIGSGTFSQVVKNGTITWILVYDENASNPISLSGVTITPSPAVTVKEDSTGSEFLDFFQTYLTTYEVSSLEQGMADLFQSSSLTQMLVTEFNASLKANT